MLKSLKINSFTVFSKAALRFSQGLNVIVGENGTGKSHLLKLGYAVLRSLVDLEKAPTKEAYSRDLARHLIAVFCPDSLGRLASRVQGHTRCTLEATWGQLGHLEVSFSTNSSELLTISAFEFEKLPSGSLFIPPKEILSVYPGFQRTLETRELKFDETYLDLVKALNASPLKGPRLQEIKTCLDPLEQLMGGTMSQDHGAFYFHSAQGAGIFEAHLMAEGNRKLGMLAYLVKTGEVRKNSSLFWDEPEANLNPKLIKQLAAILIELSKIMQITIATHSLFLLRELEILQEQKKIAVPPKFFGLHFNAEGGVEVTEGKSLSFIGDTVALDMEINQSTRYLSL